MEFSSWLYHSTRDPHGMTCVENAICAYGDFLFDFNPRRGGLQRLRSCVFGIEFFAPELKRQLQAARQALSGWDRAVPSKSPPPIPLAVANAVAMHLLLNGDEASGLAIALAFYSFGRASEVCGLLVKDLVLGGDPRLPLYSNTRAGIALWDTKTGRNQFVEVDDQSLLLRLAGWCASRHPDDSLFGLSYASLDSKFRSAVDTLLPRNRFTLHSLRHGGATNAWLSGGRIEDIMRKGRWASLRSCLRYVNAGRALLVGVTIPTRSNAEIIKLDKSWNTTSNGGIESRLRRTTGACTPQ